MGVAALLRGVGVSLATHSVDISCQVAGTGGTQEGLCTTLDVDTIPTRMFVNICG